LKTRTLASVFLVVSVVATLIPSSLAVEYATQWFRGYVVSNPDYIYGMTGGMSGWGFFVNVTEVLRGNVTTLFMSSPVPVYYWIWRTSDPPARVFDYVQIVGHIAHAPCLKEPTKSCTTVVVRPQTGGEGVQKIQSVGPCRQAWWRDVRVAGEFYPFENEKYLPLLPEVMREFGLEHLMIGVRWSAGTGSYPPGPSLQIIHDAGVTASSSLIETMVEYGPGEGSFALHYYDRLSQDEKWRFPDGTIAQDPYEVGAGRTLSGYYTWIDVSPQISMTPANPYWTNYMMDCVIDQIAWGVDSIYIDTMQMDPFLLDGDFSTHGGWGEESFRQYLSSHFSTEELGKLGIRDMTHFNFHDYLIAKHHPKIIDRPGTPYPVTSGSPYYRNVGSTFLEISETSLKDPIVKGWVIFQYVSKLNFVRQLANLTHSFRSAGGCEVPFFGETPSIWGNTLYFGSSPFDAAHAGLENIVWITDHAPLPPIGRNTGGTKLGFALSKDGAVRNRIGLVCGVPGTLISDCVFGERLINDTSNFLKILVAESYAAGGVPTLGFSYGERQISTYPYRVEANYRLITGNERQELVKYTQFVRTNKDLFLNLSSWANIGLVYSLPSLFWDYVPAFGMWGKSNPHYPEFVGSIRVLEESHTPYDVLAFGMPGILDDSHTLSKLKSYSVIILPSVTHLSEAQVEALMEYVNGGGKLLIVGSFGLDDDMNSHPNPALRGLLTNLRHSPDVLQTENLGALYEASVEQGKPDSDSFNSLLSSIVKLLGADQILSTDAPATVYVGTFIDPMTERLVIHLVNYDYTFNAKSDAVKATGPIRLHIRLPSGISPDTVTLLNPDTNSSTPLMPTLNGGFLDVEIPSLAIWSIILVGPRLRISTITTTTSTQTTAAASSTAATVQQTSSAILDNRIVIAILALTVTITVIGACLGLRKRK